MFVIDCFLFSESHTHIHKLGVALCHSDVLRQQTFLVFQGQLKILNFSFCHLLRSVTLEESNLVFTHEQHLI